MSIVLLRIKSVKSEVGVRSNATIYENIKDRLLTRPVQLGKRSVGWPDYEVRAVCAARIAGKTDIEIRKLVDYLHSRRKELLNEVLSQSLGKNEDQIIETYDQRSTESPNHTGRNKSGDSL